ncbi:hypothetical protein HJG60_008197 [Phyllostomus discolor]|uniref:Uncharacterized protein n=1 Tax=Phyllostomus discolor TaxID=89673 RepID=A0A833Z6H3_9CHIR|nr:hypothetical protein HJG60_008197 [Phyllostomus discolor]
MTASGGRAGVGPMEHRLVSGPSCHPEFLRFPPGTQGTSDLRAHPHPAALGLGSAFPVTDFRTRPGLLAEGKLGSGAPRTSPLCLLCLGTTDTQTTARRCRRTRDWKPAGRALSGPSLTSLTSAAWAACLYLLLFLT